MKCKKVEIRCQKKVGMHTQIKMEKFDDKCYELEVLR
jgi:hypothetical protein